MSQKILLFLCLYNVYSYCSYKFDRKFMAVCAFVSMNSPSVRYAPENPIILSETEESILYSDIKSVDLKSVSKLDEKLHYISLWYHTVDKYKQERYLTTPMLEAKIAMYEKQLLKRIDI